MRAGAIVGRLVVCSLTACGSKKAPLAGEAPRPECLERPDGLFCTEERQALTCRAGEVVDARDCSADGRTCVAPEGCLTCQPGTPRCDGNDLMRCSDDGSGFERVEACGDDVSCSPQGCRDLCAQARAERSYIGCEYYPVFTSNSTLDPLFKPAVVIANPNLVAAKVRIDGAGQPPVEVAVAPNSVETVMLEFLEALRSPPGSVVVRGGAYHLVSSVPVTVHQFNPLLFEIDEACKRSSSTSPTPEERKCNSLSNDASLLLPAHVLSRGEGQGIAYLAVSRPSLWSEIGTRPIAVSPGFVALVGASTKPVNVRLKSSAHTLAGDKDAGASSAANAPVVEPVPALKPGERLDTVRLGAGDVLQLLSAGPSACPGQAVATSRAGETVCPLGGEYDLTGTEIEADGPLQVIGGHNCAYVPFDRTACDHLEETMFPIETWSTDIVVPRPRAGDAQPQVVRVVSALDDNVIRFEPEERPPVTLGRGQSVELETSEHLIVHADKPITVAQFLIGQNSEARVGDPSMTIAIPTEQYRSRYAFLSPASYTINYVSIIARAEDRVLLDGDEVTEFAPIGDGSYQVAAVKLVKAGAHEVHSTFGQSVGVQIYGYADYTSYMLPGGLDLRIIGTVW